MLALGARGTGFNSLHPDHFKDHSPPGDFFVAEFLEILENLISKTQRPDIFIKNLIIVFSTLAFGLLHSQNLNILVKSLSFLLL